MAGGRETRRPSPGEAFVSENANSIDQDVGIDAGLITNLSLRGHIYTH